MQDPQQLDGIDGLQAQLLGLWTLQIVRPTIAGMSTAS